MKDNRDASDDELMQLMYRGSYDVEFEILQDP
jgi:hypothetical protein